MTFRIEIVTQIERFAALQKPWRQLWESSGGYIFQDHSWISGWLEGVKDRREIKLHVALAWDGDQLCAAMPCAIHRRSGLRVLTWAAQLFSDYCDCLVDPACCDPPIFRALWDGLRQAGGFDLISFQQVRPDAKSRTFLDRLARDGSQLQHADREERCMRIENRWPDGETFFRSLNKKGRNNYSRGKRILSELGGGASFRIVGSDEKILPILDDIMVLKQAWLRANDPSSPLLGTDNIVLRAVLNKACQSGIARIFLLETGGKLAAASINFVYAGRMEAYFTAYDPAFERASPGTILIVEYARWSFNQGLSHVDFLRGEEAFKFRMANAETRLSSFAGARTLIGQVAMSGHRWLSRRRQRQEVSQENQDNEVAAIG